jgi:hypothetical protein
MNMQYFKGKLVLKHLQHLWTNFSAPPSTISENTGILTFYEPQTQYMSSFTE